MGYSLGLNVPLKDVTFYRYGFCVKQNKALDVFEKQNEKLNTLFFFSIPENTRAEYSGTFLQFHFPVIVLRNNFMLIPSSRMFLFEEFKTPQSVAWNYIALLKTKAKNPPRGTSWRDVRRSYLKPQFSQMVLLIIKLWTRQKILGVVRRNDK